MTQKKKSDKAHLKPSIFLQSILLLFLSILFAYKLKAVKIHFHAHNFLIHIVFISAIKINFCNTKYVFQDVYDLHKQQKHDFEVVI